jgi:hypothetical protein
MIDSAYFLTFRLMEVNERDSRVVNAPVSCLEVAGSNLGA